MENKYTLENIQNFKGKYPKQIWALFFSEMWERFCFYGMRGMLMYFMTTILFMEKDVANLQYGATQSWVYAFTFIGGLFADKILGFRKSLFWGAILMIIGSIILAINPKEYFFLGIAFNVVGTGFFKPNISSMVGQLYKEGDSRTDAGFSLFYAGINVGALLGGYLCITIGKGNMLNSIIPIEYTWNVAFGLAAVAMSISLITFLLTKKSLGEIGLSPFEKSGETNKNWYQYLVYVGALICVPLIMVMVANTKYTDWFMYVIGPFSILYLLFEMRKMTKVQIQKIIAALLFILFSVIFWAIFEQAGGSLSDFSTSHISELKFLLLGNEITIDQNGVNNAANSLFVILFATPIGLVWIMLAKKKREPNTIIKFALGFLFLGLAFYIFYNVRFVANSNSIATMDIFILAYFVATIAELCLSPIGLSIMTKLAPQNLQGFMMGMWFLASAYGQYVGGLFGSSIVPEKTDSAAVSLQKYTQGYFEFAIYALIAGGILVLISYFMRKLMHDVK